MENAVLMHTPAAPPLIPDRHDPPETPRETMGNAGNAETATAPEAVPDELPRAVRRAYHRRRGIPLFQTFAAAVGVCVGIFVAATVPAGADISASLLCSEGDFLGLLIRRLAWGGIFLLAEYICGYFALGKLLVWAAPLICGLGTGAAIAGAFMMQGIPALRFVVTSAAAVAAVVFAAGTSGEMSAQLLRLVSTDKNSIVATKPAAGEYTLRFLVYLAILSASAIAEAAMRCLS